MNNEIKDIVKSPIQVFELAEAVHYKKELNAEQKDMYCEFDAWAKKIGETGLDDKHEIAAYIQKVVQPTVDETQDELIDLLFNTGNIGEFDHTDYIGEPKNTLVAHDAAKGGNVDKSYIDFRALAPKTKHSQVDTQITYLDLRRNGFRSIAKLTTFAEEALKAKMFSDIFTDINTAIVGGDQFIAESGSMPTLANMDKLALYLADRVENGDNPVIVTLSKYAQGIARMSGLTPFLSDRKKDQIDKYGMVTDYNGIPVAHFSGAKKLANGKLIIPDKVIFGIAGKIGNLDMKGNIRVYETMDNNKEQVDLKITGFEYQYVVNDIEKIGKISING